MTMNLAIGFITPPYGVNLFVGSSVAHIPFDRIVKWIWPFIGRHHRGADADHLYPAAVPCCWCKRTYPISSRLRPAEDNMFRTGKRLRR